ncbi:hypothetical protein FB451DRAFT_434089 [Mycena latifolia]|nr:hypothetical protein FB451DRAFT_434089 [Mycena latifolia]
MPDRRKSTKPVVSVDPAESPFSGFLETDRVPSLQERKTIQELLAEKTAHLAHLNSKVPKRRTGKKMPRQLRIQLDRTRRFVRYHQALIAPIRRLPVELMSEVFLLTLVDIGDDGVGSLYWDDDREGTLLLCKVCRTWREIAISTPALWNILSVVLHSSLRPLDWISTWLERSRSFPLYVQVFWGDKTPPDAINPVISLFASHLHHITALWIDGLDIEDLELVNETYPRATFPPVQSLHAPLLSVLGADLPPGSAWDWIRAACQASPRLASLTTSQFSIDWFPVINLTKLHFIDPVSMTTLLQVLEQAPGLQDISVDIKGPSVTSSTGSVLVMGSVARVEITSADDQLGPFMEQVALPRLTDLSIHQIAVWPDAEFQSFISRSSCALRALDFYDVDINEDQIITCLRQKACSALESMVISECIPPVNDLLQYLTYRENQFPNPLLKAIELGSVLANDGFLSAFAESRVRPVAELPPGVSAPGRLDKLRVSFIEGRDMAVAESHKADYARLGELQSAWPQFELEWPEPDE